MRRWGILIVAMAALAGCKTGEKDRSRDELAPADPASRKKPRTGWLEGPTPDLGKIGTPAADSWTSPQDPRFDVNREVRGILAGFVEDPDGRKVKDVFIEVEPADPVAAGDGAPVGVMTDREGYFLIKGLNPKQTYVLTAQTKSDGKPLGGRAYAQTSAERSQFIRLSLIDGLSFPDAGRMATNRPNPEKTDTPSIPVPEKTEKKDKPTETPPAAIPPPVLPSGGARLPDPVPLHDASLPSRNDGSLPPRLEPIRSPESDTPPRSVPPRPDLMTEGKEGLFRPPPASLPRETPPKPPGPQSRAIRPRSEFVLLDPLGVRREFPTGRDDLVLLDFLTSTCVPCKKAIPTLKALQSKYGTRGLEVVGVMCDPVPVAERRALASKYQRAEGLNYVVHTEPGARPGSLGDRFQVEGYPTLVLIDGSGEVLWTGHPNDSAALERILTSKLNAAK